MGSDIFLVAHGAPEGNPSYAQIPEGVNMISFADYGLRMDEAASLVAVKVLTEDQAAACGKLELCPGQYIENRLLKRLNYSEYRRISEAAAPGTKLQTLGQDWFEENSLRLCTSDVPEYCLHNDGERTCNGILARLPRVCAAEGATRVYLVCCRGEKAGAALDMSIANENYISGLSEGFTAAELFENANKEADRIIDLACREDRAQFFEEWEALDNWMQNYVVATRKGLIEDVFTEFYAETAVVNGFCSLIECYENNEDFQRFIQGNLSGREGVSDDGRPTRINPSWLTIGYYAAVKIIAAAKGKKWGEVKDLWNATPIGIREYILDCDRELIEGALEQSSESTDDESIEEIDEDD